MKKRYITIPNPVTVLDIAKEDETEIVNEDGKPITISFVYFIRGRTSDEKVFGPNIDALESALAIRNGIRGKAPGDVWEIDEDDWERLCATIRTPSAAYTPVTAIAIVPFARLVLNAPNEKPTALQRDSATTAGSGN
jgi:hypothetical protein